jgi:formate dehydrogenase
MPLFRFLSSVLQTSAGSKKIVGVFYKAGEYADKNPNFVGCVEGALGIRDWLESKGHHYIVTDDKEGLNSGQYPRNHTQLFPCFQFPLKKNLSIL